MAAVAWTGSTLSVAGDLAYAALQFYIKKGGLMQTAQDKPLLRILKGKQKMFPGGNNSSYGISLPIQGATMYSVEGMAMVQKYSHDDLINFYRPANLVRAEYPWYETVSGLVITGTDLKQDGISLVDDKTLTHSKAAETRLTSILKNRLDDFGESWSRAMNRMLWETGDAAPTVKGLLSILTDTFTTGTVGTIDSSTSTWWRHRGSLAVQASAANQTLTQLMRSEMVQLRRFGGKPTVALCGSAFLEALRLEVQAKGVYTQSNFDSKSGTNIGMSIVNLDGLNFEYDPTLDDMSRSKYCYIFDPNHVSLYTMEGEDNRVFTPTRPHNIIVLLQNVTWTGGLACDQRNCNGVYSIA
jgi:hypothetical protein